MLTNTRRCSRIALVVSFLLSSFCAHSQRVVNLVLVGPNGITQDVKEATGFVVVKEYPDDHFERLDYKRAAPLVKLRTYKGQELKEFDGRTMEYHPNGQLRLKGEYSANMKTGEWAYYNDTGGLVRVDRYERDSLVSTQDKFDDKSTSYPDERSAEFPGGNAAWRKYLVKALDKASTADKSFTSGTVYVNFVIDTIGHVQDVFVSKSVEYIIDEESIQIIRNSPPWIPAYQNGRHVKAYRRQPLTFNKE